MVIIEPFLGHFTLKNSRFKSAEILPNSTGRMTYADEISIIG